MIIIDENIMDSQRTQLINWKIHIRQIGHKIAQQGVKDEEIIPLLRKKGNITFFTRDKGFYDPTLCHESYCLVILGVNQSEVASFIRRFLKHSRFSTNALRMGNVFHIQHIGIRYYKVKDFQEQFCEWVT